MIRITETQWKQAIEGIYRGVVGPYTCHDIEDGNDVVCEYRNRGKPVLRMRIVDCNTDKLGCDCERIFEATQKLVKDVADVFIISADLWRVYDELGDQNMDGEEWLRENGYL